jgi:hypothetical protein
MGPDFMQFAAIFFFFVTHGCCKHHTILILMVVMCSVPDPRNFYADRDTGSGSDLDQSSYN